eukprot:gene15125-16880_t
MVKTPSTAAKKIVKTPAAKKSTTGKKKGNKRTESYSSSIYKVLKQVHPNTRISKSGMSILNCFLNDLFERFALEASRLVIYNKKSTITSREILSATRLLLTGELCKHAISEGTKAVSKFPAVLASDLEVGTGSQI